MEKVEEEQQLKFIAELESKGYYLKRRINLKKDTKTVTVINFICFVLMTISAFCGVLFLFKNFNQQELAELIKWQNFLVLGLGLISYSFLHELLHALIIRIFNKDNKIKFGFNGVVSFVGAEGSFNKIQYICVNIFPFLVFTIVFVLAIWLLPLKVFLGFYCLLCLNLGASSGDFYMIGTVFFLPNNIKIFGNGLETLIYYKKKR